MPSFSQRVGLAPAQKAFQLESMDDALRTHLWNALTTTVWARWQETRHYSDSRSADPIEVLARMIWGYHLKKPLDSMPPFKHDYVPSAYLEIRQHWFACKWNEAYDFLEFVLSNTPEYISKQLKTLSNHFLASENAAYRIVDMEVTPITNEAEIASIESAIECPLDPVKIHMARALQLLSDRKAPEYRNSIKESISAVEACCKYIAGDSTATLGAAIKSVTAERTMHPAMVRALSALYGFTNDAGGIRHALTEKDFAPTNAEAKFMLVTCSAFVNFLLAKSSERR